MVFPVYLPVTASFMNVSSESSPIYRNPSETTLIPRSLQYALPINGLVWLFATVTWFAWGRKRWPGLNVEVIEKVVADGDRDTKD